MEGADIKKASVEREVDPLREILFNRDLKTQAETVEAFQKYAETEENGKEKIQKWRSADKHKASLIHLAASKDKDEVCKWLVKEAGCDVNAQRESDQGTALHLSIWFGSEKATKVLKDLGADLDLKNAYEETAHDMHSKMEKYKNIVWLDLELTSLDDPKILELAVCVTKKDLTVVAEKEWVIHFDQATMEGLSPWHQKTFAPVDKGGNGLLEAVVNSSTSLDECKTELLEILKKHCPPKACPLAGNSVHQDMFVLKKEMPEVVSVLSHRLIDVSSLWGVLERFFPNRLKRLQGMAKATATGNHRAMADVKASIEQLRGMVASEEEGGVFLPELLSEE
uniref:Exonuclease domain-containing protein n=1 Tax=Chromera velia CCMP2878 TaxID=1169474 RepID=A0A0G4G2M4_9ALVE|eukprot:Cvel_19826.t1-p1 / transcript=Cvel_19826.t1 / gene=Cvel_19826 / organism=Chromera_velia_CCMP2878 / gene_product=Oligoribonuclease, putative / transcript_product=Oligoribonuclease, putative / location=Cvel_scaffold1735:25286-27389(+) / protein_length=337 / sequence_SO=supercontig / SO=protein_coding / is_pseudo=false